MRDEAVIALLLVLVIASAGAGYYVGSSRQTTTATLTETIPMNSTASSSTISTTCTIPDDGEVIMQVLNSTNGKPIASAPVQIDFLEPVCPPNPHTITALSPTMTNGTGFVAIGGEVGDYTLSVGDYGYTTSATVGPGQVACITLGIPSGETHITYTGFETLGMCSFGF